MQYYRVVNDDLVVSLDDVRLEWKNLDPDDMDADLTFPEFIDKLTTPWEEALREVKTHDELRDELTDEIELYLLELIWREPVDNLDTLRKVVMTADGIDLMTYYKLDDQILLRKKLTA